MFRSTISLMRALALVLALLVGPASAQMTLMGAGSTKNAGTPFGISWISPISAQTTSGTTFTFTSQNLGTASSTRIIGIGVGCAMGSSVALNSVTVGGNSATHATGANVFEATGMYSDFWYYQDNGALGTAATIVYNFAASVARCVVIVYNITGTGAAFSAAAVGSSTTSVSTLSATDTVPSGGGAIALLSLHSTTPAGTVTNGANLTIDSAGVASTLTTYAAGHNTTASGSTSFTFNWTGATDAAMSVVTFSP